MLAISLIVILNDKKKLGDLRPERRNFHYLFLLSIADSDSSGCARSVEGRKERSSVYAGESSGAACIAALWQRRIVKCAL